MDEIRSLETKSKKLEHLNSQLDIKIKSIDRYIKGTFSNKKF